MNQTRAAVIGSGFGGLTLAVRLQAAGIATTLIEKRDKPGGRAYVYEDKGYTFDGGPTIITAPPSLEEVFAAAGRDMSDYITLLPVMPFYRLYWEDGYSFDYSNDLEATTQQIADKNPRDAIQHGKLVHQVAFGIIGQRQSVRSIADQVQPHDDAAVGIDFEDFRRVGLVRQVVQDA